MNIKELRDISVVWRRPDGVYHCLDGPAVIYANNTGEWWIDGIYLGTQIGFYLTSLREYMDYIRCQMWYYHHPKERLQAVMKLAIHHGLLNASVTEKQFDTIYLSSSLI